MDDQIIALLPRFTREEIAATVPARPHDRKTARPHDRTTARPQDRKTARPQDRKTTRPQDRKTARPQDRKTARLCFLPAYCLLPTADCRLILRLPHHPHDVAAPDFGNLITTVSAADKLPGDVLHHGDIRAVFQSSSAIKI